MTAKDQPEVISPQGQIAFFALAGRGITNLGRHPENDIVIDSPQMPLFYAVLDHRTQPYRITVLGGAGETSIQTQTQGDRRPARPQLPVEICPWDQVQFAGFTLILIEEAGAFASPVPVSGLPRTPSPAPGDGGDGSVPGQVLPGHFAAPQGDIASGVRDGDTGRRHGPGAPGMGGAPAPGQTGTSSVPGQPQALPLRPDGAPRGFRRIVHSPTLAMTSSWPISLLARGRLK